jgi:hypothetical protein
LKGNGMNNTTTHMTQLKELHQRIVNQRDHNPSIRWELWGQIRHAEELLADARKESPGKSERAMAARKRGHCRRLTRIGIGTTVGLSILAIGAAMLGAYLPPETWILFGWMALAAGMAGSYFGMRADEFHKVVRLFDTAHLLEPEVPVEVETEEQTEWVAEANATKYLNSPAFSAAYNVPLLASV